MKYYAKLFQQGSCVIQSRCHIGQSVSCGLSTVKFRLSTVKFRFPDFQIVVILNTETFLVSQSVIDVDKTVLCYLLYFQTVSLSVIDVDHDCLCVDNCQSSDCKTVKVLDWVNPACVPVSGKSVFMLPLVLSAGQGVKELL